MKTLFSEQNAQKWQNEPSDRAFELYALKAHRALYGGDRAQ
jgi:hypothetical protein